MRPWRFQPVRSSHVVADITVALQGPCVGGRGNAQPSKQGLEEQASRPTDSVSPRPTAW